MPDLKIPDINKLQIAGRLTKDPELRYTANGKAVCKLNVVYSRKYDGKEETVFIDVDVWGQPAEYAGERLRKGVAVLVEGKLKQDEWEDRNTGKTRKEHKMNAFSVQSLQWLEDNPGGSMRGDKTIEEHAQQDDIPF